MSVDSGQLWIAERLEVNEIGHTRVDKFEAEDGKFSPPQLNEEEGVTSLQTGVGVGHVTGEEEVYVGAGQEGHGVVAVFDATTGKLQHTWTGAGTVNKSFTDSEGARVGALTGVAVDNSANLETGGDVYVSTFGFGLSNFNVIDVFKPQAGGEEPAKATTQVTGTCALEESTCPGEEVPFHSPRGVAVSAFNSDVLVTDVDNIIDVFRPTLLGEYEFVRQLTGTPTGPSESLAPFESIVAVAVDGTNGDIYVADQERHEVDQFDAEGQYLGKLTGTPSGPFHLLQSLTVDPSSEHVFVGEFDEERRTGAVDVFGPNVVIPDVKTTAASSVSVGAEGQIQATLNGTVNPVGQGEATCRFTWGTREAFGQLATCEPEGVPDGNADAPVHATIKELAPDTAYVYRLQASNKNGTNPGEASQDEEFITPGPGIHSESVSGVSSTSATLNATIDPHGAQTSYYFQYGKSAAYEAQTPAAPGAPLGSGQGDVQVAPRHIQSLDPSTVYHYRALAASVLEVEGKPTEVAFAGPDQTFKTQGQGAGLTLPDDRQWELVSPPDKHGALLSPIGEVGVIQAADNGATVTYFANLPTGETVKGYIFSSVQVLSVRDASGWHSQDISLPHVTAGALPHGLREYESFSQDLSAGIAEPIGGFASLAPEVFPPDSEITPYIRHNSTCTSAPTSCFEPLLTGAPGYANVPEGTKFGGGFQSAANFVGATPDFADVMLVSAAKLTSTPTNGAEQLYAWTAGKSPSEQLQLISVLPGGEAASAPGQLGLGNVVTRHAISDDGSRIVWSEKAGHLFIRDTAKAQTAQLDLPEAQCLENEECGGGQASPRFQMAASDGSRVLFTDTQRLSKDSGVVPERADLYECAIREAAGKLKCDLRDLTPSPGGGEAAAVQGAVIGASDDGTWVYFVANGVLGDGGERGASPGDCKLNGPKGEGACSLYVQHEGTTHFIATVAGRDARDWDTKLAHLTARVSPDGHWLAFMSQRSLTGYDNHDALSGQPDEEVFLYHAEAPQTGSLVCASCNPSGERPVGVEYAKLNGQLVGGDRVWEEDTWIAANIPGWTPYQLEHSLYQSRYLSNQGRLFFNSNDALVAQDINNNQDVYQYEPSGVGDCESSLPTFNAAAGGCVGLISSGTASGESAFLDASESGNDVFFLTNERLLPEQDIDTALDLYDAHVCSESAPCFSSEASPPPCTTAEACRAAPTPQPSIFGAPSSTTFSGEGNVPPPSTGKAKVTRAQRLSKALQSCRKKYKHAKKRRASCERQARKRFGAKQARKPSAHRKANTSKKGKR